MRFTNRFEIFDAHNASFVSVTQHFNTTTSMGRLTLNVLLSFAQFEREVTGERIRDKIAASKKKGMWMGGTVPLGYDAVDRILVVNPVEAEQVRNIYERYLALGDVTRLQAELNRRGAVSKRRVSKAGTVSGGIGFFRGALYKILQNRLYLGEISHKGTIYPGQHEAIVTQEMWEAVQERLKLNGQNRKLGIKAKESSLLAGWVFDGEGRRLIPTHTNKKGKRYRYYNVREESEGDGYKPVKVSVPAHELESTVVGAITYWLKDVSTLLADVRLQRSSANKREDVLRRAEDLAQTIAESDPTSLRALLTPMMGRLTVGTDDIQIQLLRAGICDALGIAERKSKVSKKADEDLRDAVVIPVQASLQRSGLEMKLVVNESWSGSDKPQPDWALIKAVARSHVWMQKLISGEIESLPEICRMENLSRTYVRRVIRCATLAPDIVEAILDGRQPETLMLRDIVIKQPILSWEEQRHRYGMPILGR